jgi:hypothetical protein
MGATGAQVVGVHAFTSLSRREQLSRLRRLGRTALASYGLDNARMTLLRFEHSTASLGLGSPLRLTPPGLP